MINMGRRLLFPGNKLRWRKRARFALWKIPICIQKCGEQSQDNSEICQVIFFIISVVVIVLAEYHSASPFRTVHTVVLMNTLDVTMDPACSTL